MAEQVADRVSKWNLYEIELKSEVEYDNPYMDVDMQIEFISPTKKTKIVRGFWDGEHTWRVRFAPGEEGGWTWQSYSSDQKNSGLHGKTGNFDVHPYDGANSIYKHGFLQINSNTVSYTHLRAHET